MGLLDGQEGAHLRRRQRPLDRLGHRPGPPRRGRDRRLLVGREPASSGASGRSPSASARRSSSRATSRTTRRSRRVFERWKAAHGEIDILVHALAFAKREDLEGAFVDTSRDGFALALDVTAYSLVALVREARPLLHRGSSVMTLTYYGAEKVVANYNVMGVAKAALEASVRYLAADLGPGRHPGQRDLAPARSGRSPRRASAGSSRCTARSPRSPRSARTSRSRTSAGPRSTSPRTSRRP